MKSSSNILSVALVALAAMANACVQVHTSMGNDPLVGDFMSIRVMDNGREVCKGTRRQTGASTNTQFCLESNNGCAGGYNVCVWNNGREGEFRNDSKKSTLIFNI
jgi:hypothetical protein